MRTRICLECPTCGKFELRADSMAMGLRWTEEKRFLSYSCLYCLKQYRKTLDLKVFQLLISVNVPLLDDDDAFQKLETGKLPEIEEFRAWLEKTKNPLKEVEAFFQVRLK